MSEALEYLEGVVSPQKGESSDNQWGDILGAVDFVFGEPFSREAERVMLAALRFDGPVRLAESSEMPHSMAPEDMLRSFAVQWLARETGLIYLRDMQRVEAKAVSPLLATTVRAVIQEAVKHLSTPRSCELVTLWRPKVQPAAMDVTPGTVSNLKIGFAKPAKAAFPQSSAASGGTVVRIPLEVPLKRKMRNAVRYERGFTVVADGRRAVRSREAEAARDVVQNWASK